MGLTEPRPAMKKEKKKGWKNDDTRIRGEETNQGGEDAVTSATGGTASSTVRVTVPSLHDSAGSPDRPDIYGDTRNWESWDPPSL